MKKVGDLWTRSKVNRPDKRYKETAVNYVRYLMVVIFWCCLILLAMQVDEAYQNKSTGFWGYLVGCFVYVGHEWGITYDFLYDALGGYSSILLTVIGMIVTGWVNLSERLEKRVYGIRRRELLSNKWWARCMVDSFIGVFITPAWMVYAIIRRYCFTAYFIMAMIFAEFLVSNVLIATTYNDNQDYIRLRRKISYSLKKSRI